MEAAQTPAASGSAVTDPTQGSTAGSAAPSAEASATTQSATASSPTVTADELRGLLNGYIAKHSMEAAIAVLQSFDCNRVTEALSLAPEQLRALADKLNG